MATPEETTMNFKEETTMNFKGNRNAGQHNILQHITTITHVFTIGFVLFIFYLCLSNELVFFTWHPVLLSFGWVLLMTEGVLMLSSNNALTKGLSLSYSVKVQYHWIIQAIGIACSVAGFVVIYINKNLKNKEHFHSWHGIFGLISTGCCIPVSLSGIVALYGVRFKGYIKPVNSKFIHRICGIITFIAGAVTVLLSLYTKWFQRNVSEVITVLWVITVTFVLAWSISQACVKVFIKLKSVYSHTC